MNTPSSLCPPRLAAGLSFSVALLGMLYELVLAYGLSVVVGGTYQQYGLTIGLFTLTLGLGAYLFERYSRHFVGMRRFALLQIVVATTAGIALWWILFFGFSMAPKMNPWSLQIMLLVPMALIGLVTGAELPWLMRGHSGEAQSVILGFDFLGMFAATLVFPLLLLPSFGVTGVFIGAIGGNIGVAWLTWKQGLRL